MIVRKILCFILGHAWEDLYMTLRVHPSLAREWGYMPRVTGCSRCGKMKIIKDPLSTALT